MATVVNKDFKVKNGLIVEGTTGRINNFDILTKKQADQDYIVNLIGGTSTPDNTPDTVVKRDESGNFAAGTVTVDQLTLAGTGNIRISNSDIVIANTNETDVEISAYDIRLTAADDVRVLADDLIRLETTNGYIEFDAPNGDVYVNTNSPEAKVVVKGTLDDHIGDVTVTGLTGHTVTDRIATAKSEAQQFATDAIDDLNTDAIEEGTSNLYFTNQRAIDAVGGTIGDAINELTTDDIEEGGTNLYFTDSRARGAVDSGDGLNYNSTTGVFSAHLGTGLEISVTGSIQIDDNVVVTETNLTNAINNHNVSSGVHGVEGDILGTTDTQTISNKTLGGDLAAGGFQITNLGTPNNSTDAATKGYVDAVSEGLHVHPAARAAILTNVAIATGLENGDTAGGVTLATGDRVLLNGQTNGAENGIYVVQASGPALRAADFDTALEIDSGDFIFVSAGTYANTGWVQTLKPAIIGTDPISFTQFSGAGTFTAGNGLILDGTVFEINENITATRSYVDGQLDDHIDLTANVHGVTGSVVGTSDSQTLTNKTLGSGTVLSANIDAANSYTITNLEEPVSNQDAATKSYVDAAESSALSDANDYTDGREAAITTAYQAYADQAELDAKAYADALTTADVAEQTNLYFTNQRAIDAVGGTIGDAIDALDTDDIEEGTTNLYHTSARAKSAAAELLTGATLTNITITGSGSGLTITAENGVADSDTDDLTEGSTNLYFTNARAVDALEAVVPNFEEVDINSLATQVAATISVPTASVGNVAYSFAKADYRSAEFLVKTAYGNHTEISKVLLTLDSSDNIAITEYGTVGTNGATMNISGDIDGSNVRLIVQTLNNSSTVTVVGTLLA